jgi:hypothetical protein
MSLFRGLLTILSLSPLVMGKAHRLYSGFFSGDSLYAIQFDESTSNLSVVYNGTLNIQSSKWIATDVGYSDPSIPHDRGECLCV